MTWQRFEYYDGYYKSCMTLSTLCFWDYGAVVYSGHAECWVCFDGVIVLQGLWGGQGLSASKLWLEVSDYKLLFSHGNFETERVRLRQNFAAVKC